MPNLDLPAALPFDQLNEADIQGQVIEPILACLGYQSGTDSNILRQRQIELRYPHMFLGRKKPAKDPILRGRPDYICEVRGCGRWVIEAKHPSSEIGQDDVEQAHSYAVHAEIQASIYVLCNGRSMIVYEANRGPEAEPLLRLEYPELCARPHVLTNVLGPAAFRRKYPVMAVDLGRPLATNFGSRVRIVGGNSRYDAVEAMIEGLPHGMPEPDLSNVQKFRDMVHEITGDVCYRDEADGIVAVIRMPTFHNLLRMMAKSIDLEVNEYKCAAAVISEDPQKPNIFEATIHRTLPAGEPILDITTWTESVLPFPVPFSMYSEATGYLDGTTFAGRYDARTVTQIAAPGIALRVWMFIQGTFEVEIQAI